MKQRFFETIVTLGKWCLLCSGTLLIFLLPLDRLMHESHGLIGIAFGVWTCTSAWLINKIIYIVSGRDWLYEDLLP